MPSPTEPRRDDPIPTGPSPDPVVSVVIPCYGGAGFIADAIDSVLAQDAGPLEILVIDDGSPDGDALQAVIERYGESPVRLLREPHRGPAAARNAGIAVARGRLLAFLDADDTWLPGFLQAQIDLLTRSAADLVYADAEFFGGSSKDGATVMTWDPSEEPATLAALLAGTCLPVMSTIVARTEAVRRAGGFDTDFALAEDFELWARMLAAGATLAWTREVRARRRIHDSNISHDGLEMSSARIRVIRRHEHRVPDDHPLAPVIGARLRSLEAAAHLSRVRTALDDDDAPAARRALWQVVRSGGAAKHLLGALALTVAPALAVGVLKRRLQ